MEGNATLVREGVAETACATVDSHMTFAVAGEAYDRFMGRYSRELAPRFMDFAGIEPGLSVIDVGCGPGALTKTLAERVGAGHVAAVDPSEPFVAACAERVPGADVRQAAAEELPWPDGAFDAALSQLVINFLRDAPAGAAEMRRVVPPGGIAAACTWDYGDGMQMLRAFWDAAKALAPDAPDESGMRYRTSEELAELWRGAGFADVETGSLTVETTYTGFEDFWQPITFGVGPAGAYYKELGAERQAVLRDRLYERLGSPAGPFTLSARAGAVRGVNPPA